MSNISQQQVSKLFNTLCKLLEVTNDMQYFQHFISNVATEDIRALASDTPHITISEDRCDIEVNTSKFNYFGAICLTEGGILYSHQRPI